MARSDNDVVITTFAIYGVIAVVIVEDFVVAVAGMNRVAIVACLIFVGAGRERNVGR